jgi:predicted nuclease with TOPRIM domain
VLKDTRLFLKNEKEKRNTKLRIASLEKERNTMSDEIKHLQVVNDSLKHDNTKTNSKVFVLKESNLSLKQENIKIREEIQALKDSCYLLQQALQQLQLRVNIPTQVQSTIEKMDSLVTHMEKSKQN